MKKKLISLFIVMLMISVTFSITVLAGSEEDPEIEDKPDDDVVEFLDIISAWFYEKEEEPDYLYTALKLRHIDATKTKQHLVVSWEHKGIHCSAGLYIGYDEDEWFAYQAGYGHGFWFQEHYQNIEGEYDEETGIIICKIPKNIIKNPEKGDVLTNTQALSFQRYGFIGRLGFDRWLIHTFIFLISGQRTSDYAPKENYGRDYVIQY